jgi:hypothetical protein
LCILLVYICYIYANISVSKTNALAQFPVNKANEFLLFLKSVLQGTGRRADARQLTGGGVSKDEKGRRDTSAS